MVRVVKDPEERKSELMDAAEELFSVQGFEETAVSDIVKRVGVAQGTFYYYFESKEHILNEIMDRMIEKVVQQISLLCGQSEYLATEKLNRMFLMFTRMGTDNGSLGEYMHLEKNLLLHKKLMDKSLARIKPMVVQVLKQGIADGEFNTIYPEEATELMIYGVSEYFHRHILNSASEERARYLKALEDFLERLLGAPKWSFKISSMEELNDGKNDPV